MNLKYREIICIAKWPVAWPVEGKQLQCRQNGSILIYMWIMQEQVVSLILKSPSRAGKNFSISSIDSYFTYFFLYQLEIFRLNAAGYRGVICNLW